MLSSCNYHNILLTIVSTEGPRKDSVFLKEITFSLLSTNVKKRATDTKITIEVVIDPSVGHSWKVYSWVSHFLVVEPFYFKPIIQ